MKNKLKLLLTSVILMTFVLYGCASNTQTDETTTTTTKTSADSSDVTEDTDNTEEAILDKTEIASNLLSLYGQNLSNDEYLSGKFTFYYYDTATDEDDVVTHTEIDLDIDFEKTPDVMHMEGAVSLASSLITISVEYENYIDYVNMIEYRNYSIPGLLESDSWTYEEFETDDNTDGFIYDMTLDTDNVTDLSLTQDDTGYVISGKIPFDTFEYSGIDEYFDSDTFSEFGIDLDDLYYNFTMELDSDGNLESITISLDETSNSSGTFVIESFEISLEVTDRTKINITIPSDIIQNAVLAEDDYDDYE